MTGLIILAAGASSRLGTPKQNLIYQGQTLLQRAIHTALTSACCEKIVVVLGANEGVIRPNISDHQIHITYNPNWQEGIASSIRLGISELQKLEPNITAAILMVCDQPFVDPLLIYQLNNMVIAISPVKTKNISLLTFATSKDCCTFDFLMISW